MYRPHSLFPEFLCASSLFTLNYLSKISGSNQHKDFANLCESGQACKIHFGQLHLDQMSMCIEFFLLLQREGSADSASKRGMAMETGGSGGGDDKPATGSALMEAIEMTTNGILCVCVQYVLERMFGVLYLDLKPLLTPEAVTELVMVSMQHVPSTQPTAFGASYTPIAAAGTDPQVP